MHKFKETTVSKKHLICITPIVNDGIQTNETHVPIGAEENVPVIEKLPGAIVCALVEELSDVKANASRSPY